MYLKRNNKLWVGLVGVSTCCCVTVAAQAAGFQLREHSTEGLGNAFAGSTAKAYNVSTAFYNPAGMTRLSGHQAGSSVTFIVPKAEFKGVGTLGGVPLSGSNGGDAIEDSPLGAVYGVWDLRPNVKLGLAYTIPFGLATKYPSNWVGRYIALESEVATMSLMPSLGWRVNDQLSLGFGVQLTRTDVLLSQAVNLSRLGLPDGKVEMEGDDFGYGYDIGLLYEFSPTTRIGINWRSKIDIEVEGEAKFKNVPAPVKAMVPILRNGDITGKISLPASLSLGLYHEINDQWAVMSDVSMTRWSSFDELRIKFADGRPDSLTPEEWTDNWFVSLGATYTMQPGRKLHFGFAYDEAPVSDAHRTPRIPDSDRYWASIGYSHDFSDHGSFNVGYARLFSKDVDIDDRTALGATLTGKYENASVNIFSASIAYRF